MAKYECSLTGNFDALLEQINTGIMSGSVSASFEDGSDLQLGDVRFAARVYERYSVIGNNRVSLTVTLLGRGPELHLSAITAGGSQALFFKINTMGEESFLSRLTEIVEDYRRMGYDD